MTTPNQSTSGDKSGTSGSGGDGDNQNKETYSKEFVEKLKGELSNYRTKTTTLENEVTELKNKFSSAETEELKKKNEYKTLYEQQLAKNKELTEKLTGMSEAQSGNKKKEALTKHLFKLGLEEKFLDDALKLASIKNLQIDPDTQTVFGAEEEAKNFFEKYKNLGFFRGKGKVPANHDAPRTPSKVSGVDLSKMSQKEKLAYLREHHKKD